MGVVRSTVLVVLVLLAAASAAFASRGSKPTSRWSPGRLGEPRCS